MSSPRFRISFLVPVVVQVDGRNRDAALSNAHEALRELSRRAAGTSLGYHDAQAYVDAPMAVARPPVQLRPTLITSTCGPENVDADGREVSP